MENIYQILIENSLDWLMWFDENFYVKYISPSAKTISGYNPEDFVNDKFLFFNIIHPEDKERVIKIRNEKDKNECDVEFRIIHKSGHIKWIHLRCKPLISGNNCIKGYIVSIVDITQRKEAYEKLKKNEEKYRKIFEYSLDCIIICSIDGQIIDINQAGLKLFGYRSISEIKNINFTEKLFKNLDDSKKCVEILKKYGSIKEFETIMLKKDGSEVTVLISATPIYDENNQIIAFQGIIRDVTERKIINERIQQIEKLESIGSLAGGLAHDFNNILTVILGYADIGLQKITEDNPLFKILKNIHHAAKKAEKLIKQLLAFSKKQIYSPELVDINEIIKSTLNMLKRLISEDIFIEVVLHEDLPYIKADISQIEQILMNLIVNANDALSEIKIPGYKKKIIIETGKAIIDKNYTKIHPDSLPGNYVFFAVSDNGPGMDKKTLNRIFEPFFTTKGKHKGTGLGLAVVYGIVKQNNGFINVYSELGKGTTVKIYWPSTEEKIESKDSYMSDDLRYGNETILFVEDNEQIREVISEGLNSLGYKVFAAENGLKALEFLKNYKEKIDLVITDVVMPLMNGKEFVKRAKEIYPDLKVIYTSGYTDNHIVHNGILENNIIFLQKPYRLQDLSKLLKKLLD